jgi:beta-phosphoglucomutase-like phosphatase (HAD superfamily)
MTLDAIIFDVDGTLAETEEIHRAAFNRAFRDAGLAWHWDRALYGELLQVTGGKERLRHFIHSRGLESAVAARPSLVAALHERKTAYYGELVRSGAAPLRRGFGALIRQARNDGIRLAIATTTSLPNVHALLHAALGPQGIADFELIAAGDSVARKKPAPDIYLRVLAALQLASRNCLAVEDSHQGLRAARAADLATLIVRSTYTQRDDFAGAAQVVDELDQLSGEPSAPPDLLAALRALHERTNSDPG